MAPTSPPTLPTQSETTDYGHVVLERRLRDVPTALNPSLPASALDDALRRLIRPQGSTLEARNRSFHRMLVNGVEIEYRDSDARVRGDQVRVIDFDNPSNNNWQAVNQFNVTEDRYNRRPGIVLFLNGLPLGTIELKNPADEDATVWTAWQQLQTCKAELLDREIFYTLLEVRVLTERYRQTYNRVRPHSALGYRPPAPETLLPADPVPVLVGVT